MESVDSFVVDPLISWADLPISQCIMRKLKARYDASEVRHDCTFEKLTARLHALRAHESQFDFIHPLFLEGEQIAARMEKFLRENEEVGHAEPVHSGMGSTTHFTEAEAPPHPHQTALPPTAPLQRRDPAPGTQPYPPRDQAPQMRSAHPEIGPESTLPKSVPPVPPQSDSKKRHIVSDLAYTPEEFWEHCVIQVRTTKKRLSVLQLSHSFSESGNYSTQPKHHTVKSWIQGQRRRFSVEQVYAAAELHGSWDPTGHTRPVADYMPLNKRSRDDSRSGRECDSSDQSHGNKRPRQQASAAGCGAAATAAAAAAAAVAGQQAAPAAATLRAAPAESAADGSAAGGAAAAAAADRGDDSDGGGDGCPSPPSSPLLPLTPAPPAAAYGPSAAAARPAPDAATHAAVAGQQAAPAAATLRAAPAESAADGSAAAGGAAAAAAAEVGRGDDSDGGGDGAPGAPADYGGGGGGGYTCWKVWLKLFVYRYRWFPGRDSEKPEVMLRVSAGDTVASMKELLATQEGFPAKYQRWFYSGRELTDQMVVGHCDDSPWFLGDSGRRVVHVLMPPYA